MKTLNEVLTLAVQYLKEKGDSRARRHAEDLLAYVLKVARLELYLQFDRPLSEEELASYRGYLKRIIQGEPSEYIVGEIEFYGCRLHVSPAALIPRPETEILIDQVSKAVKEETRVVWDICCGSGCLGLALKRKHSGLDVVLSDLSSEALELAKKNSEQNGLEVELILGDLLKPFEGKKADLVVCNPPYISQKEFNELDRSVKEFEPAMALIGGEDGLEFYRRLAQELPLHLNPGAQVFLEIGKDQGAAVKELFDSNHWRSKRLEKDWAGHDRFFFLEFE